MNEPSNGNGQNVRREEIVKQLESILCSQAFGSSKRCQEFLEYIVRETLEGRKGDINERSIASSVFGKSHRFDPTEDALVRVKAHEVRRRLNDFYREQPDAKVRIELPHGGYAPDFHSQEHAKPVEADVAEVEPKAPELGQIKKAGLTRRRLVWLLGGLIAASAAVPELLDVTESSTESDLDKLWDAVVRANQPLLISLPILTTREGTLSDRVGIGAAAAVASAAQFLDAHKIKFFLRFGAGLTFAQIREQPSLILGGFSSSWSMWATKDLPYRLVHGQSWSESYIEDARTKRRWNPVGMTPDGYAQQDYGIVCRFFDPVTEQVLFLAAGITTFGTEGAASVLFDRSAFAQVLHGAPSDWPNRNLEAVVTVSIMGTTPSTATVVAKHFW